MSITRNTPTASRRAAIAAVVLAATLVLADSTQATTEPAPAAQPEASPATERQAAPDTPAGDSADAMRAAIAEDGSVRVIVSTHMPVVPEAELSTAGVVSQRAAISQSLDGVEAALAGTGSRVIERYDVVPGAIVDLDEAGVDALLADPDVASVTIDREAPLALDDSTRIIDSVALNAAGVRGDGRTHGRRFEVVIADSGVALRHPAVVGRIVSQACFSATGFCPNGGRQQLRGNAGRACTYASECYHGTHVAGIAAGRRYPGGHQGVAPDAGIVAIQVGHRSTDCGFGPSPCWRYFFSDLDRALQRVLKLRRGGRNIASVNLSLGGPLFRDKPTCGRTFRVTDQLTKNLLAAGVAVVAAAGNNGARGVISYPSCLPAVYAVGATTKGDRVASFSNSSRGLSWWAPGARISSAFPGGRTAVASGTSMAAPHVAGAFTLLRQCPGNVGPRAVATDLSATGRPVRRAQIVRKRINVFAAAVRNVRNDDFRNARRLPGNRFNVAGSNSCASSQRGEPPVGNPENSIWYSWTPTRSGRAVVTTNDWRRHRTTFDTEVSVFRGRRLQNLSRIAYDDNSGMGVRSWIALRVRAGEIYRIRVDGVGARNGLVSLRLNVS